MRTSRPPRSGSPSALPALLRATHLFGLALGSAFGRGPRSSKQLPEKPPHEPALRSPMPLIIRREVEPAHVVPPEGAQDQHLEADRCLEEDHRLLRRVVTLDSLADRGKQHRGVLMGLEPSCYLRRSE